MIDIFFAIIAGLSSGYLLCHVEDNYHIDYHIVIPAFLIAGSLAVILFPLLTALVFGISLFVWVLSCFLQESPLR